MENRNEVYKKKVFSGLIWKFGERLCAQGVSFLVSVVLARLLLPEDYGLISMVLIFITIADVFVTSGFSTALIQKRNATNKDFSTIFYCGFAVSLVVYLILFLTAPLIAKFYRQPQLALILRVFALRIPISAYNSVQSAYVSRHMIFRKFFFATLIGTILSGVVGIVMALSGCGVWALVCQYLTNTIVDTIVLRFTIPWHLSREFSWASAKSMMSYGWKVLAADLSGTFFDQLRGMVIGRMYTTADLAFYNKGNQLPNLITSNISSSVMTVLFPAIANVSDDEERVKQMIRRAVKLMAFIVFPMMVGLMAVAKPLIVVLLTEKWSQTSFFVQMLSLSSVVGLLSNVSIQAIKAIGRSDVLLRLEIYKKPVYFVLLIIGAMINVETVAVTMVIYSLYSSYVNMLQLKKYVHYSIVEQLRDILPEIGLSAIMYCVVAPMVLLPVGYFPVLCIQVLVGAAVYVAAAKLSKCESFVYLCNFLKEKMKKQ